MATSLLWNHYHYSISKIKQCRARLVFGWATAVSSVFHTFIIWYQYCLQSVISYELTSTWMSSKGVMNNNKWQYKELVHNHKKSHHCTRFCCFCQWFVNDHSTKTDTLMGNNLFKLIFKKQIIIIPHLVMRSPRITAEAS